MAVAVDAVGSADLTNFPGGTSANFTNLTVGAGQIERCLRSSRSENNAAQPTGISVTWNGVALFPIANTLVFDGTTLMGLVMYGVANPAPGNNTRALS